MQAAALIAEFNPFHNGHQYILEQIRSMTSGAPIIVIMSGDFVQRGEPAIFSKQSRTRMALNAGADLVIELPVRFACGNAGEFARGAIALLHQLPCVKWLFFGSESGDLSLLQTMTRSLLSAGHEERYRTLLNHYLKEGVSYPAARARAYLDYSRPDKETRPAAIAVLSDPNEALAMEYLKALSLFHAKIEPVAVKRVQSGYHDTVLPGTSQEPFCPSAAAIRKKLRQWEKQAACAEKKEAEKASLDCCLPPENHSCFDAAAKNLLTADALCPYLGSRLLFLDRKQLASYLDCSLDLAGTITKACRTPFSSFDELAGRIKGKNITLSRARRVLLHMALELKKWDDRDEFPFLSLADHLPVRVLGFRKPFAGLLKGCKAPVITTGASMNRYLQGGGVLLEESLRASMLYRQLVFQTHQSLLPDEYHAFPIIC